MLRTTDVFTIVCPDAVCGHTIDRSAWWLLQREARGFCPVCGANLAAAIERQQHALRRQGYAGLPSARAAPIAPPEPRPQDDASIAS